MTPDEAAQAQRLLATVLPPLWRRCAPYGVPAFAEFLLAATSIPPEISGLRLDMVPDGDRVAAVADWRLVEQDLGLLNGMAVVGDQRGRGLATRLLNNGLEHAAKRGLSGLELQVMSSNVAAQALYARSGFVDTAQRATWSMHSLGPDAPPTGIISNWSTATACYERYGFADIGLALPGGSATVRMLASGVVRMSEEAFRQPATLALCARLPGARDVCVVSGPAPRAAADVRLIEFQTWRLDL